MCIKEEKICTLKKVTLPEKRLRGKMNSKKWLLYL